MLLLTLLSVVLTGSYFHPDAVLAFALQLPTFSLTAFHSLIGAVLAAPSPPDVSGITETVDNIVEAAKAIGRPIAIAGVVLVALSWLAAGAVPDWAKQNQGVLTKIVIGGILLGIAPDLVDLFMPAAS